MNGCGNPCATCGQSPCACTNPTVLNQPRLLQPTVAGGIFTGGTFNGPTINGGTATGQQIVGATIDCTTQGCTQAPGTSDSTLATTAFVQVAINDAISGSNPDFCAAVQTCVAGSPTLCSEIINCINTTPGSINNIIAFDPAVFATTLQVGVIRIATLGELQGASCGVAIDPCTLEAFFLAGGPNTLWNAFSAAVDSLITASAALCPAVFACGAAPLDSPAFTNLPTAPTPPPVDNSTRLATTAFVNTFVVNAINGAISALNPAFCLAVAACGGGGGGGNFASFTLPVTHDGVNSFPAGPPTANYGCSVAVGANGTNVSFNVAQPDMNFIMTGTTRFSTGGIPNGMAAGDGVGGAGTILATDIPPFANASVAGLTDLRVLAPTVGGGVPYNGFVTVVFSR